MNELLNHLWQSTGFTIAVAALCWAMRSNHARTRYWLWLAASLKFLLPFSLFISLGRRVELPAANGALVATTVEAITTTFEPVPALLTNQPSLWPLVWISVWITGAAILCGRWLAEWLRLRAIVQAATPTVAPDCPVPVRITRTTIEPGVVGLFRPILLLPEGLIRALPPAQFQAILAHELCHIRYRDNFAAALHMAVTATFWFHPIVWWIGANLLKERERACDESVLRQGGDSNAYAEGMLNVCRFCLESPLACAAGISGADLKERIREILTHRRTDRLTRLQRIGIVAAAAASIGWPTLIGIVRAQTLPPAPKYKFEVASIRRSNANSPTNRLGPTPQGGLHGENVNVLQLIGIAYDVLPFQLSGAPGWAEAERFHVEAIPEAGEPPADRAAMIDRLRQRTQALLMERFGLVLRVEKKDMPVYALTVARSGHKLAKSAAATPLRMESNPVSIRAANVDMSALVRTLSKLLRRPVMDETGLSGSYDLTLEWAAETPAGEAAEESGGPTIFTAIQEQLGLRLEWKRAPVPVFAVVKLERPSEN